MVCSSRFVRVIQIIGGLAVYALEEPLLLSGKVIQLQGGAVCSSRFVRVIQIIAALAGCRNI